MNDAPSTNDTPRWQLWLLARLPRPLALGIMLLLVSIVSLLVALLMMGGFILLVMLLKPIGITAMGVLAALFVLAFVAGLRIIYTDLNQQLPAREKKKDADDAG
jgi:hypothetical protein